jgi:Ca2+-binding RTX toxin-like protein
VFSAAAGGANADRISVFESGSDEIAFENAVFTRLGAEGAWASGDGRFYAAAGASAAQDASDRLVYDTESGELYYDADGSGGAGALIVATLEGAPTLAASDITVI